MRGSVNFDPSKPARTAVDVLRDWLILVFGAATLTGCAAAGLGSGRLAAVTVVLAGAAFCLLVAFLVTASVTGG